MFDRHVYYLAHHSEILERNRLYRESHREALRERAKRWRESHLEVNRERLRVYSKRYYYSHLESERKRCREYAKRSSESIREYKHNWYLAHRSAILEHQRVLDACRSPESLERKRVLERERYRRLKGL